MNKTLTKKEVILRAVELAKKSTFGVTGIKVELEANFSRSSVYGGDANCENELCENGYLYESGVTERQCGNPDCDDCPMVTRPQGENKIHDCYFDRKNFSSNEFCHQWMLRELAQYGLAKKNSFTGLYSPKKPLVYAKFYNDISVGSEFTFTISLKKSENIFKVPKVIEAWKALGDAIGRGIDVSNAGMHTALINDPECYYDPSSSVGFTRVNQFANFKRSMQLLLPALYMLGSDNEHSRSLHFRQPIISDRDKYSAVHYVGGALEFRVFETCYDNPERILDNFVVMRNCIRFWTNSYRSPNVSETIKAMKFGNDDSETIERFYQTTTHLDVLNAGLKKLKPAYLTIKEVKQQRGFNLDKHVINRELRQEAKKAELEFEEYENRFNWRVETTKVLRKAQYMDRYTTVAPEDKETVMAAAEADATTKVEQLEQERRNIKEYVKERAQEMLTRRQGKYDLRTA